MSFISDIRVMADIPRYHARVRPDHLAMDFEGRQTTYAALDKKTNQVARALLSEGLKPQSRVGFIGKNSDNYFEILYGCAKANVVMVGVNWRLAAPEMEYILNDAQAEILFVGPEYASLVDTIRGDLKHTRKFVVLEKPHEDWSFYDTWRDAQAESDPNVHVEREDVAVQMYTSGTTGRPKGAMLTNLGFMAGFECDPNGEAGDWNSWQAEDVSYVGMPAFHIGGTGWANQGFYHGATNIIAREFSPESVLDAIKTFGITRIFMVPAAIQFVLQHPDARGTDYGTVKYILYGASPIPLDLLKEAMDVFGCGFIQLYGMTEMTGTVTYLPPEDHDAQGNARMRSAGKALPGMKIAIFDAGGKALPPGDIGEIAIHAATAMKGYWNLPDESRKALPADGWLRSGDAGYMDKDGYVYVHDRVKDMIVSGGENVYPAEVENAIYGHPSVADVAVIGVPSEKWGEEVKAIVVLKEDVSCSEDEIIAFCREKIAAFKSPKSVDFIAELPRNPSGKILKKDLRTKYWEGKERLVN